MIRIKSPRQKQTSIKTLELLLAALIGFILTFWAAKLETGNSMGGDILPGASAQSLSPETVASEVYGKMPDIPKENGYIRPDSQQKDPENTLISRIVRYHQYIKARPTVFRLDWKLTLADYLGVNEMLDERRYPGATTLTVNPLEGDKKAIDSLTMSQRQQLVDSIVSIYQRMAGNDAPSQTAEPKQPPTPEKNTSEPPLILPQPGGAQLLL